MRISMNTRRKGTAQAVFDRMQRLTGADVEKGLVAAGQLLKEESLKLVPRDTDELAKSCRLSKFDSGFKTVVRVEYGGDPNYSKIVFSPAENRIVLRIPAKYAWMQHQNVTYKHKVGQANFLGEPLKTKLNAMRIKFIQAIRKP